MAKCLKFNAIYTLSTSPDPRHYTNVKRRCSKLLHNAEISYLQQTI